MKQEQLVNDITRRLVTCHINDVHKIKGYLTQEKNILQSMIQQTGVVTK